MLKIIFLLLISLPLKSEELVLAYNNLPPHIYKNELGQASGPLVTFMLEHLAPAMDVEIKLIGMPLARIFKKMDMGEINGIAIAGYTTKRNQKYIYASQNIHIMESVFAVKKASKLQTIDSIINSKNIRIGYFKGGITTPYIVDNDINLKNIYGVNVWNRNLRRLVNNRVDVIYSPSKLNMLHTIKYNNAFNKVNIIEIPEKRVELYTIFSNSPTNDKMNIVNRYNKAFSDINGTYVYNNLLAKSLLTDDIK